MNNITLEKQSGFFVSCIEQIPDSCKGIVIAVHGFSSSKECSTYQVLLRKLPRAGLGLIGIDLPGHGKGESYAETLRIEACKESIAAAEKYICNVYPTIPVYYFGSSFGAYMIGLYLSTREHTGRRAFFRSAAVNMPDLFIKENPSEAEQEMLRQLNEEGFFYYSLDDAHQPVRITQGFYDDLAKNNLFEIFDPARFGSNEVAMAHGLEDVVINPQKVRAFSEKFQIPVHFFKNEGHSLGSAADTPDKVTDLAICHFMRNMDST